MGKTTADVVFVLLPVQVELLLLVFFWRFDLPGLVSFSDVRHVGQAYSTPQLCSRCRHAGRRRQSPSNRIYHLEASSKNISNNFRSFLITHYSVVRGRMLVLAVVNNHDIGVWESDLSTFVLDKY